MDPLTIEVHPGMGYDCNVFLIDNEVIIDAGTGLNHLNFMDWLRERTDPENIHTLILTHRHYDHTGGAIDIMRDTGATAYVHKDDAPPVLNGDPVTTGARAFGGIQEAIEAVQIDESHTFEINGHVLKVIHTPGHTIGSISLFEEETGVLFSGDTIFANGGVGRWDLATGNLEALRKSIADLSKLEITDLYPGHDVIVKGKGKHHANLSRQSIGLDPFDLMMRRVEKITKSK